MPFYDYQCEVGHVHEAMVSVEQCNESRSCPVCQSAARKVWLRAPGLVGPVFSDVERYEAALLTKKQRDAGVRITSKKDVDALEAKHGLSRVDPNSRAHRARIEDQKDEARDIERIKATEGRAAVADHLAKTTMKQSMGWDNTQYGRWKELKDAAEQRVQSGAAAQHIRPEQPVGGRTA